MSNAADSTQGSRRIEFARTTCIVAGMSLEDFFSGPGAPEFLQSLSECITSVGSEAFNAYYLDLIEKIIRADQCMIFAFQDDRPECYLSFNKRHKLSAVNLAERYLRHGFKDDPIRSVVDEVRMTDGIRIVDLAEPRGIVFSDTRPVQDPAHNIVDKISIVGAKEGKVLLLNFYRFEESGAFKRSETRLRVPFWHAIATLALMHFFGKQSVVLRSPLNSLSKREKDICEAMLQGLTSDAIAWQMNLSVNTVNTYRKRAYSKLGINSKSALFAMCSGQNVD